MSDEYERRTASLPMITDASGCGDWTTIVNDLDELMRMLREAAYGTDDDGKNAEEKGEDDDDSEGHDPWWRCKAHQFSRIHIRRSRRRYLSDPQWMAMVQLLVPYLRALRIDDLIDEPMNQLTGGKCSMAMNGRGLHYFAPLECFGATLMRLELRGTDREGWDGDDPECVRLMVKSLDLGKLVCLQYLKMANLTFDEEDVEAFGACTELRHIVFECCAFRAKRESISEAFVKMTNLITFSSVGASTYRTNLEKEPQPRGFTSESSTFHSICGHFDDIRELPDLPDGIEEIDLSCAAAVTSISNALDGTKVSSSLKRISLAFCPQIENDAVEVLGKCPELLQVNLDGTSVTDVSPLLNCEKLRMLSLRFTECADPHLDNAWNERRNGKPFFMAPIIYWEPPLGSKKKKASDSEVTTGKKRQLDAE